MLVNLHDWCAKNPSRAVGARFRFDYGNCVVREFTVVATKASGGESVTIGRLDDGREDGFDDTVDVAIVATGFTPQSWHKFSIPAQQARVGDIIDACGSPVVCDGKVLASGAKDAVEGETLVVDAMTRGQVRVLRRDVTRVTRYVKECVAPGKPCTVDDLLAHAPLAALIGATVEDSAGRRAVVAAANSQDRCLRVRASSGDAWSLYSPTKLTVVRWATLKSLPTVPLDVEPTPCTCKTCPQHASTSSPAALLNTRAEAPKGPEARVQARVDNEWDLMDRLCGDA